MAYLPGYGGRKRNENAAWQAYRAARPGGIDGDRGGNLNAEWSVRFGGAGWRQRMALAVGRAAPGRSARRGRRPPTTCPLTTRRPPLTTVAPKRPSARLLSTGRGIKDRVTGTASSRHGRTGGHDGRVRAGQGGWSVRRASGSLPLDIRAAAWRRRGFPVLRADGLLRRLPRSRRRLTPPGGGHYRSPGSRHHRPPSTGLLPDTVSCLARGRAVGGIVSDGDVEESATVGPQPVGLRAGDAGAGRAPLHRPSTTPPTASGGRGPGRAVRGGYAPADPPPRGAVPGPVVVFLGPQQPRPAQGDSPGHLRLVELRCLRQRV